MRTTRRNTPREPVRDQRQIVEVAAFEPPLRRGRSRAAWAKVRRSSAESRTQADMRTSRSYGGRARVHRSSRKRVAKPRRSRCGITPSPWRHEDRVVDRDSLSPATGQLTSGQNCVTAWLLFDRVRLASPSGQPAFAEATRGRADQSSALIGFTDPHRRGRGSKTPPPDARDESLAHACVNQIVSTQAIACNRLQRQPSRAMCAAAALRSVSAYTSAIPGDRWPSTTRAASMPILRRSSVAAAWRS